MRGALRFSGDPASGANSSGHKAGRLGRIELHPSRAKSAAPPPCLMPVGDERRLALFSGDNSKFRRIYCG